MELTQVQWEFIQFKNASISLAACVFVTIRVQKLGDDPSNRCPQVNNFTFKMTTNSKETIL